jgi:hypothetical protein
MAIQQVGPDHVIGGVIHVEITEDSAKPKDQAFSAKINAPGFFRYAQHRQRGFTNVSDAWR